MSVRLFKFWGLLLMALASPAEAETVAQASSPGNILSVSVEISGEGRPGYKVMRNGRELIGESRIGFILADAPKIDRNMAFVKMETANFDQTWEQPWGEWKHIRNKYNELFVSLQEKSGSKRTLNVRFRLYDDGVGFRFEFPEQPNLKVAHIQEELTQFNVIGDATAWWIPAMEHNREEYLYNTTPISEVGLAQTL